MADVARAWGEESDEENFAKGQKTPPPAGTQYFAMTPVDDASVPELCGGRPAPLPEVAGWQGKDARRPCDYCPVFSPVPCMVEVIEMLADVVMQPVVPQERISEHIVEPIVVSELVGIPQEQISERIAEPIVVSELVGIPQERISEHIVEPIDVSVLVGIPLLQTSERIPEPFVACELVGFPHEQTLEQVPEPIVTAELVGFPQEQTSERIPELIDTSELVGIPREQTSERIPEPIVTAELVGFPQEHTSERIPELIAVPGLGVVDLNDPHGAEEALRILRRVAARRQAELVEEDVDEEEYEDESEFEVNVPVSRFPSGWRPMRMCRAFLAGGSGVCPYGQRCTFAHHRSELHPRLRQPGPY